MHAPYVRVWFLAGLVALALSVPLSFFPTPTLGPVALVAGLAYLALALALGLLPAFARRDWPSPVYAWAGALLGALAAASVLLHVPPGTSGSSAAPAAAPRVFHALLGASLVVGALQPLALLLSPRWSGEAEPNAHRATDRAALAGVAVALAGAAAAGLLLVALPRGLPNAALAVALLGSALPAAFAALLFVLPRQANAPLPAATLAYAALGALALAAGALAWSFARPFEAQFPAAVALTGLAYALAITALLRAPRPDGARGLLAGAFALAILAALALALATAGGGAALFPVALYAQAALALALLAGALVIAAPLVLPGRVTGAPRWTRWGPALLIAALFLFTPALQYARSAAPAAVVGAIGLLWMLAGLARLAVPAGAPSSRRTRSRKR